MNRNDQRRRGRLSYSWAVFFLTVGLQACQDGTGPVPVGEVTIAGAATVSMQPGDSLTLVATVLDGVGRTLAGREVTWSSTAPAVAAISGDGRLLAISAGEARIVAVAGAAADTVSVTVSSPPSVATCSVEAAGLAIGVGETRQLAIGGETSCLPGTENGAEYLLVAFNGREVGRVDLTIAGGGLQPGLTGYRGPSVAASSGEPEPDLGFESALRRRERTALAGFVPALRASLEREGPQPSLSRAAAIPAVGQTLALNASLEPCTQGPRRGGRVAAVTERAIVVHDTTNPGGGFTDEEYREIGLAFDTLVYPVDVENFGEPTDLDSNRRVIIFYTRAVNEMTKRGSESYVGGFFFSRDLFPAASQAGFQGCAGSNYAEMFYALAPDPSGIVNGNARAKDFVRRVTVGTLAHELQHLISASRRLYVTKAVDFSEEVWLNEGLSHIAEELVFYRASGLGPRQNIALDRVRSTTTIRTAFNQYMASNLGRLQRYLESPEGSSPFAHDDSLSTRGAAWAFLRYAADRGGSDQAALWKRLVNSKLSGMANLRSALGTDPIPLARDWSTSVFADDATAPVAALYQQPSWNFRSLYTALSAGSTGYPLRIRALSGGTPSTVTLAAGGASFHRLSVAPGGRAELQLTSGGVAPPSSLSLLVLRTR